MCLNATGNGVICCQKWQNMSWNQRLWAVRHHGSEQVWVCRLLLAPLIKDRKKKKASGGEWTLRFGRGLIEAIVAFFFYADMKGMMVVEVVFGHEMGCCSSASSLLLLSPVMRKCESLVSRVRTRSHFFFLCTPVWSTTMARWGKGQPCCRAIKMCRSVGAEVAASPAWHYRCAILRGKCPPSPRCDHTSSLGGLCWLTGVSAKYGTHMISWPRPPPSPSRPPVYLCRSALASRSVTHLPHLAAEIAFA